MSYLAIDPGKDTGWAYFRSADGLISCGCGDPRQIFGPGGAAAGVPVSSVLIEKPQVYSARHSKGDPNDLITLAIQVGRYAEHFESRGARVALILPHDWKGTLPKDIQHARMFAEIGDAGRSVVDACGRHVAPSKRHNMLDAVCLGRVAFRRKLWTP